MLTAGLALGPAAVVGAQDADPVGPEHTLEDVVARVLAELGLPAPTIDDMMGEVMDGVADHIDTLVEAGIIAPDRVETIAIALEEGTFDEVILSVVEETRERRDAFRDAAASILTDLGIEVPDGVPIRDVLAEADLTPDALGELLTDAGVELPPPPMPPQLPCPDGGPRDAGGECPVPVVEPLPQPTVRPTPPPTTTAPPPPTTTEAPAPPTGYPETGPSTPAPSYPQAGSQPAPADPPPPTPTYPTPPAAAVDTEEQL